MQNTCITPLQGTANHGWDTKQRCRHAAGCAASTHPDTCASHAAARRRGGIEPLRVSTPHAASVPEWNILVSSAIAGFSWWRGLLCDMLDHNWDTKQRCRHAAGCAASTHPDTCASHAAARRRGGIELLRVSTPHELKSCPSTSPTHPGIRVRTVGLMTCGSSAGVVAFAKHMHHTTARHGKPRLGHQAAL